jgi:hypothetical protein
MRDLLWDFTVPSNKEGYNGTPPKKSKKKRGGKNQTPSRSYSANHDQDNG